MKKTNTRRRVSLLLVLCLTLSVLLCSCGKSGGASVNYDSTAFSFETEEELTSHSLTSSQLNAVAALLCKEYSSDFKTNELLFAAYRGYDMLAEGFDDTTVTETPEDAASRNNGEQINVAAVINVIDKANSAASAEDKLTVDYSILNEEDVKSLVKAFQTTVNLDKSNSFWDAILRAVGAFLGWLTDVLGFGNYIIGICLFSIVIEILMLPFAIRQQKNSIRQANLRPKEMAIRNKYKGRNDQATAQKVQQEIQEMYQRENFSPYSGCLPLLLQFPIIIALYEIVIDPLRYVLGQASGISSAIASYFTAAKAAGGLGNTIASSKGTIAILSNLRGNSSVIDGLKGFVGFSNGADVSTAFEGFFNKIPNFNLGSVNMGLNPEIGNISILWLVPVLTFVAYFFTAKINRKFMAQPTTSGVDDRQVACSNTMMDITMPAMSTFFTFYVPALVGVYWIFRSLLGLLKQFIMSRVMPLPKFTEEDYKAAARELAGKRVIKKSENVGKVRSLHHIDDEDYDDTRERALARKAAIEAREAQEKAGKSDRVESAPMKETNNHEKKKEKPEDTNASEAEQQNDGQND